MATRRTFAFLATVAAALAAATPGAQNITLANRPDSVKFAVLGDAGTGEPPQYQVADRLIAARSAFTYDFVILVGDNLYGRQEPADYVTKFERPYAALLTAKVPFFAALGNHDKPESRHYAAFGMKGERYYSYTRGHVRFVVLDTNLLEPRQIAWAGETLAAATEPWKIVYLHHPLYSNAGRHGSNVEIRVALEPMFIRHGVQVVFAGHDHVYERTRPQKGITHFVVGSSGMLRKGDMRASPATAASFDQDQAFSLVEVAAEQMFFQTISRTGTTVDAGVIARRPTT